MQRCIKKNKVAKLFKESAIIVATGQPTRDTLENLGIRVDVMPSRYLFEDDVEAQRILEVDYS
ncbi:MAG: hypothetical protein H3Z49_07625 [archaeon]|nr:hypothetical protein [archaeon]